MMMKHKPANPGGEGNNEINKRILAAEPHQLYTLIVARKAEFDHICELIEAHAEEFDAVNVATAFRKLLQSRRDGVPRGVVERALQALEECALMKIENFQPKQLATTLHAMAKGRYHPSNSRVLEALEQQATATASTFIAQDVGGGDGGHVQRAERGKPAVGVCNDAAGARGGAEASAGGAGGGDCGHFRSAARGKHAVDVSDDRVEARGGAG